MKGFDVYTLWAWILWGLQQSIMQKNWQTPSDSVKELIKIFEKMHLLSVCLLIQNHF